MIIIKDGKNFSKTYASIAFDEWGSPTNEEIHIIEHPGQLQQYGFPADSTYIDSNEQIDIDMQPYCDMIENTLWVFNNEPIKIRPSEVYTTGAGVNWMFHDSNVYVYDISKIQCKFIEELLENWNGKDYGTFVYNFIVKNKIKHFHLNLKEKQDSAKELIKNKIEFIDKINQNFDMLLQKYKPDWQWRPENIIVKNENILKLLSKKNINKFLLSNVLNFKHYFVKNYIDHCKDLISPSTKAFLKSFAVTKPNPYPDPPCEQVELNVPVADVYHEIIKIRKYLVNHRSESGMGWKSFCIHGQNYKRTREKNAYPDFHGYNWTPEALENMPKTVSWLKTLGFKNYARVRVMCLEPKGFINLHRDRKESNLGPINVAITNPNGCDFWLENHGRLEFEPGRAFRLNLVNYHCVINNSNVPRYHIIIHHE